MTTVAQGHIVHGAGKRTRVRIPAHRGDEGYFKRTAAALKSCPGVQNVEANALTGSLLIEHDAPLEDIGDFAKVRELFALSQQIPAVATLTHRLLDLAREFDRGLQAATQGRVNGMEAAALVLLVLGLYKLLKTDVLPPASTLFWYAAAALAVARKPTTPAAKA